MRLKSLRRLVCPWCFVSSSTRERTGRKTTAMVSLEIFIYHLLYLYSFSVSQFKARYFSRTTELSWGDDLSYLHTWFIFLAGVDCRHNIERFNIIWRELMALYHPFESWVTLNDLEQEHGRHVCFYIIMQISHAFFIERFQVFNQDLLLVFWLNLFRIASYFIFFFNHSMTQI